MTNAVKNVSKTFKYRFRLLTLPTAIGIGETPGLIPNPEVKPDPVPRCTVFREGTGSAEAVGTCKILTRKVFKLNLVYSC